MHLSFFRSLMWSLEQMHPWVLGRKAAAAATTALSSASPTAAMVGSREEVHLGASLPATSSYPPSQQQLLLYDKLYDTALLALDLRPTTAALVGNLERSHTHAAQIIMLTGTTRGRGLGRGDLGYGPLGTLGLSTLNWDDPLAIVMCKSPGCDTHTSQTLICTGTFCAGTELRTFPEPQEVLASLEGALRSHYRPPPPGLSPTSLAQRLEAFLSLVALDAAVACSFLREMLGAAAAAGASCNSCLSAAAAIIGPVNSALATIRKAANALLAAPDGAEAVVPVSRSLARALRQILDCTGTCADLEELVDLTDLVSLSASSASPSSRGSGGSAAKARLERPRSNWPYQLASMYVAAAAVAQLLPPVCLGTERTIDRVQLAVTLLQEPAVDYSSGKAKKEAARKLERRWNGLLEELAATLTETLALVAAACSGPWLPRTWKDDGGAGAGAAWQQHGGADVVAAVVTCSHPHHCGNGKDVGVDGGDDALSPANRRLELLAEAQLESECVELLLRVMQAMASAGVPGLLRQAGACLSQLLGRLMQAKGAEVAAEGQATTAAAAVSLLLGTVRAQDSLMRLAASLAQLTALGGKKSATAAAAAASAPPHQQRPQLPPSLMPSSAERVADDCAAACGWCALVLESGPLQQLASSREAVQLLCEVGSGAVSASTPSLSGSAVQQQLHQSLSQMLGSSRSCTGSMSRASAAAAESAASSSGGGSNAGGGGQQQRGGGGGGGAAGLGQLKPLLKACRVAEEGMSTACARLGSTLQARAASGVGVGRRPGEGGGGRKGGGGSQQRPSASSSSLAAADAAPSACVEELLQEAVKSALALGGRLKTVSELRGGGSSSASSVAATAVSSPSRKSSGEIPRASAANGASKDVTPRDVGGEAPISLLPVSFPWQVCNASLCSSV